MTSSDRPSASPAFFLPIVLVLVAVAYRYAKMAGVVNIPALENFNPWMALAFTGTLLFPKRVSFLVAPLLLLAVSLAAAGPAAILQWEAVAVYATFAGAAWLASQWRGKLGMVGGLLGVAGCSLAFYVITNTISWVSYPYTKDFAGWLQALTTGEPGHLPSWWFLRNSLVSDLGFSVLLLAAHNTEATLRRERSIPLVAAA
ncbi:MAG TPA: DUF6580 family putative transport protein [Prosthecobacter sp.]